MATLLDSPVELLVSANSLLGNYMAAAQCIQAYRRDQDHLLTSNSIRVRKKGDKSDFECGIVVGLGISETADLLRMSLYSHLYSLQRM